MTVAIVEEQALADADTQRIYAGLLATDPPGQPREFAPLNLTLRDSEGRLVGGAVAATLWTWLLVDVLWVAAVVLALAGVVVLATPSDAQSRSGSATPSAGALELDTLLASKGPSWKRAESRHFILYTEREGMPARSAPVLLDSLEAAWRHAIALIGAPVADTPPVPVLVTTSRTRFPQLLSPEAKGLTTTNARRQEFIILVHNDSVRAHTRHEVMHVVARRAWNWPGPTAGWLVEGLATFADGSCQGLPLSVVARDLLRGQRSLSAQRVVEDFWELHRTTRASAYVLAGSLVDYLWTSRGREGVRRLWVGMDTLSFAASSLAGVMAGKSAGNPTAAWRAYVEKTAGSRAGLATSRFQRLGCG